MLCTAPRFADLAPGEAWAILLDEGVYLGSQSTFYRLLRRAGETRERRRQATHPAAVKPELLATGPNQVWSWDITKLHGPAKWTYYYLYVILDIYSRYVTGWMLAPRESAALAEKLIADTCAKQGISRGQLTIHADRGSSMTSKPVAFLLADLGVTQSHSPPARLQRQPLLRKRSSRPSNTGPASPAASPPSRPPEPTARQFFAWYNHDHRHSRHRPAHPLRPPPRTRPGRPPRTARHRPVRRFHRPTPSDSSARPPEPPEIPAHLLDQPAPEQGTPTQ